jgi:serine/threonine-protein phosphatase 6 regulatory ankyrin repeat subunit B
VADGDLERLEELAMDPIDVDERNAHGRTPIFAAVEGGHWYVVAFLLSSGCNANAADHAGETPLAVASRNGALKIATLLLVAGANPCTESQEQPAAVRLAAEFGHPSVVELLLKMQADPDARSVSGTTGLMAAARRGHAECVGVLLAGQADATAVADYGYSALHLASDRGHHAVTVELLDHVDVNVASAVPLEIRAEFFESGQDGSSYYHNFTPLMLAAGKGYLDVVRVLIEAEAYADYSPAGPEFTPIKLAEFNRHGAVCRYLSVQPERLNGDEYVKRRRTA